LTTTCHLSRFAMSISRRATSAELSTSTLYGHMNLFFPTMTIDITSQYICLSFWITLYSTMILVIPVTYSPRVPPISFLSTNHH
jgi:hypothetical protein